jgi:glycosyltransferase involved in cell wall biosynthesis
MPYAVAEALATGVPVVASDIPGHRVLCEGLGACRLTSLDANGIAAATNALLARGPAEAEAEADAAAERMRDSFDLRSWCDRLLDLYEDVLDAGRPALRQRPG